jgi:hypothetical protein
MTARGAPVGTMTSEAAVNTPLVGRHDSRSLRVEPVGAEEGASAPTGVG